MHALCPPAPLVLFTAILILLLPPAPLQAQDASEPAMLRITAADGTVQVLDPRADTDGDGIENELELDGFAFDIRSGELSACTPGVDVPCYQTDPFRWSTDGDPYSDFMEVSGANLDGIEAPYNHPLVTARPIISVYMTDYQVIPVGEITDTEGRSISSEFTNSTTVQEELGGSITTGVSLNPLELASVEMEVNYSYTQATTNSSTSASGFDWSTARTVQEDEAARLRLNLYYVNQGSASASEVRPTISLRLGSRTIATFVVGDNATANAMAPGERYPESGTIAVQSYEDGGDSREITLSLDELKALQRGAPLSLVVTQVDAMIERWDPDSQSFFSDIPWAQFEDRIAPVTVTVDANIGGELHRYQVFTGSPQYEEPWFDLQDVLALVFDVAERGDGVYINERRYPDRWYMSTDSEPLLDAWEAAGKPENFLSLPMERRNRLVMLSPGSDAAPNMHFSTYSEDLQYVFTSSSAVGGFPIQRAEATLYIEEGVRTIDLDAYQDRPYFTNTEPFGETFYGGFVTVYNARGDARVQDLRAPGRTSALRTCAQFAEATGTTSTYEYPNLFMTGTPGVPIQVECNLSDLLYPVEDPWASTDWPEGLDPDYEAGLSAGTVHVLSEQVALGAYGSRYGPSSPALRRSTDGGLTWTDVPDVTNTIIADIAFLDESTGFAVGSFGKVFTTTDAGATWTEVRQPFTDSGLTGVDFFDDRHGLIVGGGGTALRTSDGGQTWASMDVDGRGTTLSDVAMLGLDHFVISTFDAVLTSTDDGATWSETSASGVMEPPAGDPCCSSVKGLHFPTRTTGYAFNSSGLMKTTDGGRTWSGLDGNTRMSAGATGVGVTDAHFFDATHGLAIAGRVVLHTADGGLTWYEQEAGADAYGALHFNGAAGLLTGRTDEDEPGRYPLVYRTEPVDLRSGPGGEPYSVRPKSLLVYLHDDPAAINGAATTDEAAQELGQYDYVILADWPALSPNAQRLYDVLDHPAMANTRVFGRADIGVTTANYTISELKGQIAMLMGASMAGVFLDNFGYDTGVTRDRQNEMVQFVTEAADLQAIVHATDPDDAFSSAVDATYNPDGLAPMIGETDFYFWDGFQVEDGSAVEFAAWREKADQLAAYRVPYRFGIVSSTTPGDGGTFDEALFAYTWHAALLDGHTATGWGEPGYSATSAEAPYYDRPVFDPGRTFFTDLQIDPPFVRRQTEGGEVRLNTETYEVYTGASTVAIEDEAGDELPQQVRLDQNYPNPFNPSTTIAFSLARPEHVRLEVFDLLGRRVALLVNETRPTGQHQVRFDGRDLASGLYLYRLIAGPVVQTRTMVLVK